MATPPLKDYYASATIRLQAPTSPHWHLWSVRLQAPSLAAARAQALALIAGQECEYGGLQVLWDASPVATPVEPLHDALTTDRLEVEYETLCLQWILDHPTDVPKLE